MKIRPRIFLEGNFFVDLQPGTPSAPDARRRRHDPGHADGDAGAARPGADRAAGATRARTCRTLLDGARHRRSTASRRRPRTPTPTRRRAGKTAAQALNDAIALRPSARCAGTAIVNEALPGHRARPRPLAADRRACAHDRRRSWRNEQQLKDLITNFNTTIGGARVARRATCARRSALLAPTLASADARARRAQRRVPDRRARSRARSCPASRETAATIDAAFPWIDQTRAARRARPSCRALAARPAPGDGRPRARSSTRVAASCCRRPTWRASCATRRRPADRRRGDQRRRVHDRRRELQGVLLHAGRPRRRGPELRRQRPLRALPGRRRRRRRCRSGSRAASRRPAVRQRDRRRRSATAPAYPGKRPPYKPDVPCYKQPAAGPQRPDGRQVGPTRASRRGLGTRRDDAAERGRR